MPLAMYHAMRSNRDGWPIRGTRRRTIIELPTCEVIHIDNSLKSYIDQFGCYSLFPNSAAYDGSIIKDFEIIKALFL